jgi:hypothetical protein
VEERASRVPPLIYASPLPPDHGTMDNFDYLMIGIDIVLLIALFWLHTMA